MTTERKQMIRAAFDTVASGYDHPVMTFFPATAQRMLSYLALDPSCHLLDVCTGTGAVSVNAAEQLVTGRVTAIDLSSGMLHEAEKKARQRGLDNVSFRQMDMEHMDLPANSFDAATCSFGIFFVEEMEQVLRNIAARVKDGGKVAISTFVEDAFEPCSSRFLALYEGFGREVTNPTWKRIASESALRELFGAAGIDNVEIHHEPLGAHISPLQWWDIVWNAGYRGYLQQLDADELGAFKQQHLAELHQLCSGEQLWLNTGVMIAIGQR